MTFIICISSADAVSRSGKTTARERNASTSTVTKSSRGTTSRNAVKTVVTPRNTRAVTILTPKKTVATRTSVSRNTNRQTKNVSPRAAASSQVVSETRTGAEYEQCKTAFFTCMDQFCQLKNDNFRRCSCNDRVFDFQDISEVYQKASERLSEFSEDLDVVGMTKEQATAMKTASEGEDAMTEDKSASKQLLQAIMNSIKGENTSVGGKYKDLNSVNVSADMSNAFGMDDSGQIIASYNGANLYKAVFPKCKNAVKEDCNKASLQRAINAYLMAIEQDCNTVEAALQNQKKALKASTHQSSAMLDLARVENRRNHNSEDVSTCLSSVEEAIKSEEVCGESYHKCLDYGQFIDVTTGAPLTGVADFYKLGELLTYKTDSDIKDQKLSSIKNNRKFVQFFENKTKKFAKDALDRCSEEADYVWQQYLDKALLDIYYAQKSKVKDIKQSCLTLIAKCYDNQNAAIADAMAKLTGDSNILLHPEALSLSTQMCTEYIESCDGMFTGIIKEYIETKDSTDSLTACRAVAQQCFDNFGSTGYNGFYSLQGGLFEPGEAIDWFSLYKKDSNGDYIVNENNEKIIVSPCAKQVADISACSEEQLLTKVFGGFDKYVNNSDGTEKLIGYGYSSEGGNDDGTRQIRTTGIATEIYYKILSNLSDNCNGLGGYFVEYKDAKRHGYNPKKLCHINSDSQSSVFFINTANTVNSLVYWYHFVENENMCPSNYEITIDTQSWGLCSCWENGGQRSKNGTTATCRPLLPAISGDKNEDVVCSQDTLCSGKSYSADDPAYSMCQQPYSSTSLYWCQQSIKSSDGKLCPTMNIGKRASEASEESEESEESEQPESEESTETGVPVLTGDFDCVDNDGVAIKAVIDKVPEHK